ncbi:GspE/PulE family protein [Adhaeribacter soli]|nr:GspE/PulE family protein [Adhaeribacter soli]
MQVISAEQAWHYRLIPKHREANRLHFYIDQEAYDPSLDDELEVILGSAVVLEPVGSTRIESTLLKYFVKQEQARFTKTTAPGSNEFLNDLIGEARHLGSSDIHIETYEGKARVRLRLDGMLVERYLLGKPDYPALVNKVKIMANLDIAEKRLPQDGRIFFTHNNHKFDVRVSVVPTLYGEKVVLRLLSNDATNIDIHRLGFQELDLANYLEGVKRPSGMLLISGPTGSGKTTTLYATLKLLNKESRNILTIEDPIEYTLEGINQVQLRENIGLDFASALRTFLRQDPDIIMVGEIRDTATANMAVRASLTGHLVLSTIHTNSAWGTVSRLIDMGVPPFLLANTLNTTVAQRLLRLLCPQCKQKQPFDKMLYPRQFKPYREIKFHYLAKGCDRCYFTGYRGRRAVYEVIPVDADLAERIKSQQFEVSDLLRERGIKTLTENAFELFEQGETSIEEIFPLLFYV